MGERWEIFKKSLRRSPGMARSSYRKAKRLKKERERREAELLKIKEGIKDRDSKVVTKEFSRFLKESRKEIKYLDDIIQYLLVIFNREVERLKKLQRKVRRNDPTKEHIRALLQTARKELDDWQAMMEKFARGGSMIVVKMDETTLLQEGWGVSRVLSRLLRRQNRDESRVERDVSSSSTDPNKEARDVKQLEQDAKEVLKMEQKAFFDFEQLELQEDKVIMQELQDIIHMLGVMGYPATDLKELNDQFQELKTYLHDMFKKQAANVNTTIRLFENASL